MSVRGRYLHGVVRSVARGRAGPRGSVPEALPHGLRYEPLFASGRMLIVPRGHELAGKKRPTLRDLARRAFVIPPAGSTSRRLIEAAFLRAGLRLEIAMEAGGWMSMGW